jgi:hypothetical protein
MKQAANPAAYQKPTKLMTRGIVHQCTSDTKANTEADYQPSRISEAQETQQACTGMPNDTL